MRLSVVVPTRDRATQLPATLQPLLDDPDVAEVVVVDDGSLDATGDVLAALAASHPRLRPLRTPGVGKAGAEQLALEATTGEVVLFLDDDVVAGPGLAAGHLRRHAESEGRVVVGYMPVRPVPDHPGLGPARIYSFDYERTCEDFERSPSTILHNLWGGNVSLRRDDALRIGISSPAFGPGWRHVDRDFGLRCLEGGLVAVFDRALRASHHYERSLAATVADARAQGLGRVRVHRLHEAIIGPFAPDDLRTASLGRRRAVVVRLATTRWGHGPTVALLTLGVRAAIRLGDVHREDVLVRLLRRSEQSFHAVQASARGVDELEQAPS